MTDYERWLTEIEREYAREHGEVIVDRTRHGCVVSTRSGLFIAEVDYDPDPHAEERVRY